MIPEKTLIFCKAETLNSFSQRKINLNSKAVALLFLAKLPVYTRSIEVWKYKSEVRIGVRLKSCTNLPGQK